MSTPIVVFSLEPWDGVWRRNQYLVHGLLERDPDRRVLFIEPPTDIAHDVASRRRPRRGRGLRPGDDHYAGRLQLLEPTKWLPRIFGPLADMLLRRAVLRVLRRNGSDEVVLWFNDPTWAEMLVGRSGPSLYDMTDDWLAADRSERIHARLVAQEAILFERCAAVVVCSEGLQRSRSRARPDLVLIPNAVDVARYRSPTARPGDLPSGPYALYVGTLHEDRLDVALVLETARALEEAGASMVLLGPNALSAAHRDGLRSAPGVVLLGPRSHTSVPAYMQHADVLVVPHVVDEFTESLDPLKLYEYLAVGRPVVSTPVAGFRDFSSAPGFVVVDATTYPSAVRAALGAGPSEVHATVPDWSDRVEAFTELLARIEPHAADESR